MAEREQRVTPLELFFDLVFVFGITQVTGLMSDDPTWHGLGTGMLVLAALWWAWAAYAWLTNTLDAEAESVRLAMLGAMGAMLIVALAVPEAFDDHGVLFGVAYLLVRLLHLVLYALAGKRDADLLGAVLRMVPSSTLGPALIVAAGFLDGEAQATLWVAALAIDYLGVLVGRGAGWRVSPAHFAERHGLIVIIALGESIVALGIGAAGVPLDTGIVVAALLGMTVVAALWWAYFDIFAIAAQTALSEARGVARATLARDYYSYLHMPMIAGIVLFALGVKKTLEHVDEPLATVPAVALCGGLALYYLTHVAFRFRLARSFGIGRPIAGLAALALLPAALEVRALVALALAAAISCGLIVWDVVHYWEDRARIRSGGPADRVGAVDGLDRVTVRVDDARVAARRRLERLQGVGVRSRQAEVEAYGGGGLHEPDGAGLALETEIGAPPVRPVEQDDVAERRQDALVEALRRLVVADGNGHVVDWHAAIIVRSCY
ncbi:MAG: low temperature requirement protein A [Gaiellaceae bacterium]